MNFDRGWKIKMTTIDHESSREARRDSGYPNVIELSRRLKFIVTHHKLSFAVYIGELRANKMVIREEKLLRART